MSRWRSWTRTCRTRYFYGCDLWVGRSLFFISMLDHRLEENWERGWLFMEARRRQWLRFPNCRCIGLQRWTVEQLISELERQRIEG